MNRVLIGRPDLGFCGNFLGEIVKKIQNFGVGRYVIKRSELKFSETSYYKLTRVEPFMPDTSHVRVRAWAERVYRGKHLGEVQVKDFQQPDWHLVERHQEQELLSRPLVPPSNKQVNVIFPLPPLLQMHVQQNWDNLQKPYGSSTVAPLLRIQPKYSKLAFEEVLPPTEAQMASVWPPWESTPRRVKKMSTQYYFRREDYPGLYWKVELEPEKKDSTIHKGVEENLVGSSVPLEKLAEKSDS